MPASLRFCPFSLSDATWQEMLSNHKKHKSHKLFFVPFVAIPD